MHARLLSLLLLAACSDSDTARQSTPVQPNEVQGQTTPELRLSGPLVEAPWLQEHSEHEQLLILDARGSEAYAAGHLPGAVHLDYAATYDSRPEHNRDVAEARVLNALFGSRGIGLEKTLVIYGDDEDYRPPARLFWVLEVHGHPSCGVLNGGYQAWLAVGGELSQDEVVPIPSQFLARFEPDRYTDRLGVIRAIEDQDAVLVDTRVMEDYAGTRKRPEFTRWGHIPGAISREAKQLESYNEDLGCTSLAPNAFAELFEDLADEQVILYCNSGRSASIGYLALRSMGTEVSVYDGSWKEWSSYPELPIETGSMTDTRDQAR